MPSLRVHLLHILATTLLAGAAAGQTIPGTPLAGLKERWTEALRSIRIPGSAIVVVRGDEVVLLEAIGIRNLERQPVTPDTIFYIASCTKPYVATRLAQLADAGKVDLDAPVKGYLPRFRLADADQTEKLTVRDLLTHRQGLHSAPIVLLDAYTGQINDDRYYHFLSQVQPQGKCEYSNIHFTLAGRIVESLDGKSWRDALQDHLFKPAGMTRTTGYASRMYGDEDCAHPLDIKGVEWTPAAVRKTDLTMHAAGGLGTTARDLGRWLRLNLSGGVIDGQRLLSQATLEQMLVLQAKVTQRSPFPDIQEDGFGLGWQVGSFKGRRLISHGGGYTGATAYVSFMPDDGIGVAILCNMGGPAGAFARVVMLDVYRNLLQTEVADPLPEFIANATRTFERRTAEEPAPEQVTATDLSLAPAKYIGSYQNDHWGVLRIERKDNRLVALLGDLPLQLKAAGIDRFELRGGPTPWCPAHFDLDGDNVTRLSVQISRFGAVPFTRRPN